MKKDTLSIYVLNGVEAPASQMRRELIAAVRKHARRAMKALNIVTPVNITIQCRAEWTIGETGETGYTPTGEWIQITLDLTGRKHPVETVLKERASATVYHEMCHIKRWLTTGFGSTFEEELISEGLACAFEMEQWKHDIPPLFLASGKEITALLSLVKENKERINTNYSYYDWFTRGDKTIPRWLGYKLGYHVISEVLRINPGLVVSDLMSLPAKEVIYMSQIDLGLRDSSYAPDAIVPA